MDDQAKIDNMRDMLVLCAQQFRRYGDDQKAQLDSGTFTMVERRKLADDVERNLGIAGIIDRLVAEVTS